MPRERRPRRSRDSARDRPVPVHGIGRGIGRRLRRAVRAGRRLGARLLRERDGGIQVLWAASLAGLLGFSGLATDVGLWYMHKRDAQTAADAAAVAAGLALKDGATVTGIREAAELAAERNGFTVGTDITIAVNRPPTLGIHAGNDDAVEIIVARRFDPLFAGIFVEGDISIRSRAVAALAETEGGDGNDCLLSLGTSGRGLEIYGSANMALGCGVSVASTSSDAFRITGAAQIDAERICVAGGAEIHGSVVFNNATPETGCTPPPDPLADLPVPDHDPCSCDHTNFSVGGGGNTVTIWPGTYCGGIKLGGGNNTLNMQPGVYVLAGGGMQLGGGNTVAQGDGVTIYNTRSCSGSYGSINLGGSSRATLTAPTEGPYAGVLFFNDRAPANNSNFDMVGAFVSDMDGVIYWANPNGQVNFHGSAAQGQTCGFKVIATSMRYTGAAAVAQQHPDCANSHVSIGGAGVTSVRLIE